MQKIFWLLIFLLSVSSTSAFRSIPSWWRDLFWWIRDSKEIRISLLHDSPKLNNATDTVELSTFETSTTTSKKLKKLTKKPPATTVCTRLTEKQLYFKLQDFGGYSQKFLANSVDEAALFFQDDFSLPNDFNEKFNKTFLDDEDDVLKRVQILDDALQSPEFEESKIKCTEKCHYIKAIMKNLDINLDGARNISSNFSSQAEDYNENKTIVQKFDDSAGFKNTCSLDKFIVIGDCKLNTVNTHNQNAVFDQQYQHLCSYCRGVYILPANCFPRFINAIKCNMVENEQFVSCIHETWSNRGHGKCVPQMTHLNIMRNVGDAKCPEWTSQTISFPTSCECLLRRDSWLKV